MLPIQWKLVTSVRLPYKYLKPYEYMYAFAMDTCYVTCTVCVKTWIECSETVFRP